MVESVRDDEQIKCRVEATHSGARIRMVGSPIIVRTVVVAIDFIMLTNTSQLSSIMFNVINLTHSLEHFPGGTYYY